MQHPTPAMIKQRIDQPFYDAVVKSAGLAISFNQLNYVAFDGPGGPGEVKPLAGVEPLTRFSAKCEQLPELDIHNGKLDLLQYSTYHYLVKAVRFYVVVDGVEIFGSATALRDHGFFKVGDELRVPVDKFDGSAYVRMEPLTPSHGRDPAPYHRFFARNLQELSNVYLILKRDAKVKEVSFLPDSFDQLVEQLVK